MSLSEAIREGALRRAQAFGGVYAAGGSDPFGAALDAIMGFPVPDDQAEDRYLRVLAVRFPEVLAGAPRRCPACGRRSRARDALVVIGVHLNDDHRWTREETATWVEREEARIHELA